MARRINFGIRRNEPQFVRQLCIDASGEIESDILRGTGRKPSDDLKHEAGTLIGASG